MPPSGRRPGTGKRIALVTAGAVVLAGAGVGGWAVYNFVASGPQPAEALPASTIGYASIDLDPAGKQKLEALKFLNKFPSFESEVGLDSDDDIREKLFDEVQKDAQCDGLDYGDDIEPWLGDRLGMAAVDLGEEEPTPVVVIQVKDKGKAEDGMDKILDCAGGGVEGSGDMGGFVVQDDWLIAAETQDLAQKTVDEADKGTLADDEDYERWTDEIGDAGFVNMYAGPALGDYLADHPELLDSGLGGSDYGMSTGEDWSDGAGAAGLADDVTGSDVPDALMEALRDFGGAAGVIRFDDGTVEFAMAADASDELISSDGIFSDQGGDIVAGLPDDTAAAFGVGFQDNWLQTMLDRAVELSGGDISTDEVLSELETETGLDLPGDLETLLGDQAVVAVGGDIDPDSLQNSDGTDVPIGVLTKGDPEGAEAALDKLRASAGTDSSPFLDSTSDGDLLAVGPDSGYRDELIEGGDLGGTDKFRDVVPEADRASVAFYLDFDAADNWLVELTMGDDQELADNLEPLSAAGMSSWVDDDVAHSSIRISTE